MKRISSLLICISSTLLITAQAENNSLNETSAKTFSLFSEEDDLDQSVTQNDPLVSDWDDSFFDEEELSSNEIAKSNSVENDPNLIPENELELLSQIPTNIIKEEKSSFEELAIEPKTKDVTPLFSLEDEHAALPSIESKKEITTTSFNKNQIALSDPKTNIEKAQEPSYTLAVKEDFKKQTGPVSIDLKQVFSGSPIIYTILLILSIFTVALWLYNFLSLSSSGSMPEGIIKNIRNKLNSNQYDEALALCNQHNSIFCKMLSSGISSRKQGLNIIVESMRLEGKRASVSFWQRMALLNDVALVAPMIGLLGTVLGMFYAFYDLNRSVESMSNLFDGLGISVGTTVAGLIVAILALFFHSLTKYRLVRRLAIIEDEANSFAALIDSKKQKPTTEI